MRAATTVTHLSCLRGWVFSLALLWCAPLAATPVANLYEVDVLVTERSAEARAEGAAEALETMVVRLSGLTGAAANPTVQDAKANALRYVLEYGYATTDATVERDGETVPATELNLKFSAQALERLLRQANLPLWPANRPDVVMWLVVDEYGRGRSWASSSDYPAVREAVQAATTARGLPAVFPLYDLEDQISLDANRAWAMDEAGLQAASARYNTNGIVLGRLSRNARGQWRGSWLLLIDDERRLVESSAPDLALMTQQGIGQIADELANRYAINPMDSAAGNAELSVVGVDSFARYRALLDLLQQINVVVDTQMATMAGDQVLLRLAIEGEPRALEQALALERRLEPVPAPESPLPGNRIAPPPAADAPPENVDASTLAPVAAAVPTPTFYYRWVD